MQVSATQILFGLLAAINLVPSLVAFAPAKISKLYGVDVTDPALITLLHHRAVMLGIVGGVLAAAIFIPSIRWVALCAGTVSMMSFIVIAAMNNQLGGSLSRIAFVDAIGIPLIVALIWLMLKK
jgi:hypothetical protein